MALNKNSGKWRVLVFLFFYFLFYFIFFLVLGGGSQGEQHGTHAGMFDLAVSFGSTIYQEEHHTFVSAARMALVPPSALSALVSP